MSRSSPEGGWQTVTVLLERALSEQRWSIEGIIPYMLYVTLGLILVTVTVLVLTRRRAVA